VVPIYKRNRALFRSNDYSENRSNEDYAYGTFQVVYDDMKTVSFSETWKLIFQTMWLLNQELSSYTNDVEQEVEFAND
jgi:hypothetical protein